MTACTICGAATLGHDDDDEAWCRYCFEHFMLSQQVVPRRERGRAEAPPVAVFTREALLAMQTEREGVDHA